MSTVGRMQPASVELVCSLDQTLEQLWGPAPCWLHLQGSTESAAHCCLHVNGLTPAAKVSYSRCTVLLGLLHWRAIPTHCTLACAGVPV